MLMSLSLLLLLLLVAVELPLSLASRFDSIRAADGSHSVAEVGLDGGRGGSLLGEDMVSFFFLPSSNVLFVDDVFHSINQSINQSIKMCWTNPSVYPTCTLAPEVQTMKFHATNPCCASFRAQAQGGCQGCEGKECYAMTLRRRILQSVVCNNDNE
jgi:hypothetical protein